jgi:hypothetical protein
VEEYEKSTTHQDCVDRAAAALRKAEGDGGPSEFVDRESWLRIADHWTRLAAVIR